MWKVVASWAEILRIAIMALKIIASLALKTIGSWAVKFIIASWAINLIVASCADILWIAFVMAYKMVAACAWILSMTSMALKIVVSWA